MSTIFKLSIVLDVSEVALSLLDISQGASCPVVKYVSKHEMGRRCNTRMDTMSMYACCSSVLPNLSSVGFGVYFIVKCQACRWSSREPLYILATGRGIHQ